MKKNCSTCERRFKGKSARGWCQAFTEKPRECWVWTDDPEWLENVNKQIEEYKKNYK